MARIPSLSFVLVLAAAALPGAQNSDCPSDGFLDVANQPGPGGDYPMPELQVECEGTTMIVRGNGIPHYEFVQVTPNPLLTSDREYRINLDPRLAETPSPIPLLGTVGVAINGIPFFGPNEGAEPFPGFGDPIYNSIMDACMGHTAREYHYHALVQACLAANVKTGDPSPILGYAADSFPVHGPYGCIDEDCSEVVKFKSSWERLREPEIDSWDAYRYVPRESAEYLDRCNGHSGADADGRYHYHATETWPYILGCYSGTPSGDAGAHAPPTRETRGRRRQGPPVDPRPTAEQVKKAAAALDLEETVVASALRTSDERVVPMNFLASSRTLGVEEAALREGLGVPPRRRRGPPPGQLAPGEEPPCRFRCGQSDDDAVGCSLTPEHKVVCSRPCDNNKCG